MSLVYAVSHMFVFFQAEDGIRDLTVTGVQTCALPILSAALVVLFVLGPLAFASRDMTHGHRWFAWLAYFGALGAGFMLIEVAVLQRFVLLRSEERRVGKECRSRWSPYH